MQDRPSTGAWLQESVQPTLSQEETAEWQAAWVQAQEEGTFFFAYPHHCAVGTKT